MNYDDFLHSKIQIAPNSGFSVSAKDIHPALKPHQRDAVFGRKHNQMKKNFCDRCGQMIDWEGVEHDAGRSD